MIQGFYGLDIPYYPSQLNKTLFVADISKTSVEDSLFELSIFRIKNISKIREDKWICAYDTIVFEPKIIRMEFDINKDSICDVKWSDKLQPIEFNSDNSVLLVSDDLLDIINCVQCFAYFTRMLNQ